MRNMTEAKPDALLVAVGTKCQHGVMPQRPSQRTFRLNEKQAKTWEDALSQSGLSQQKAVETLVEALGADLIPSLLELRAELFRREKK